MDNLKGKLGDLEKILDELRITVCLVNNSDDEKKPFLTYGPLNKLLDKNENYTLRIELTKPDSKVVVTHNLNYDEIIDEISKCLIGSTAYNSKVYLIPKGKSLVEGVAS